jgi:hypothetical protein
VSKENLDALWRKHPWAAAMVEVETERMGELVADESAANTRSEDMTLICGERAGIEGSAPRPCASCGVSLMLSPESQRVVSARDARGLVTLVSCLRCAQLAAGEQEKTLPA